MQFTEQVSIAASSAESHEYYRSEEMSVPFRGIYYGLLFSALMVLLTVALYFGTSVLIHRL